MRSPGKKSRNEAVSSFNTKHRRTRRDRSDGSISKNETSSKSLTKKKPRVVLAKKSKRPSRY